MCDEKLSPYSVERDANPKYFSRDCEEIYVGANTRVKSFLTSLGSTIYLREFCHY